MLIDIPDNQRLLLIVFATEKWVEIRDDPAMRAEAQECEAVLRTLQTPVDGIASSIPGTNMVKFVSRDGQVRELPRDVLDRISEPFTG